VNDTPRFASRTEMQFAKRQRQLALPVRHAAAAIALGLLLGFLGPFRTGTVLPPAVRYAFWLGLALFGYACVLAARQIVQRPAAGALRLAIVTLMSAVPQTFATAWALSLVQPERKFGPLHLVALVGPVTIVQLGLALAASRLATRSLPVPPPPLGGPTALPFLQRVPLRLGRELVALEAEDHYLRVHTALGSELVLARFSDAVAQLAGHSGLQVHRGWWVADDAVTGVEGSAGRTVVRLRNGLVAPVSRTYLQAVRSRGWPKA